MAQFQYTAVNTGGKKLSGVIAAATEDEARKQLNVFGVSILEIKKTADTPEASVTKEPGTSEELTKFEFEAFDKAGKKIVGTVPASSRYKAFQRLVEEYSFEVAYVVPFGASVEDKEKAKKEDLSILKAEYAENSKKKGVVANEGEQVNKEFEEKRLALLKKVDFILSKIKELVAKYDQEMKAENKKVIQSFIDKLLRIKSSTNLDYIEHVSEELLKKVQDQEIFLHKEKMGAEHSRIQLQTEQLMAELHSGKVEQKGISDDIESIYNKFDKSENKLLKGLSNLLLRFVATPEEKELKSVLRSVSRQVWVFRKIWFMAPKETKQEAYVSLQKVIEERNRLREEFRKLKAKRSQVQTVEEGPFEPLILEELNSFLGWLLSFYLVAYFLSYYFLAKEMPNPSILPNNFNLLSSETLRYLLISVFIWYGLFSFKLEYLKYRSWANGLVIGLGVILNAVLVFNL
jgi:hypothetical protein